MDEIVYLTIKGIRVHPEVCEERYVQRCDLAVCQGRCCRLGAWVDLARYKRILGVAEQLKPLLLPALRDERLWFEGDRKVDSDYPSGYCVGTRTHKLAGDEERCVFWRDGKCQLQVLGGWEYKPYYCALYPLTLEAGILKIDHDHAALLGWNCQQLATEKRPFFQTFREEVVLVLGRDGYAELEAQCISRRST